MTLLVKVLISAIAIPAHWLTYLGVWEMYHRVKMDHYDGRLYIVMVVPVMVAIWSRSGTAKQKTIAWLAGLAVLSLTLAISWVVVSLTFRHSRFDWWWSLLPAIPYIMGGAGGWLTTAFALRQAKFEPVGRIDEA